MLMAVERKRKKRRKRNIRKRRNTRSTRSIRRRRVVVLLQLEMDKKTRSWRRMESRERWNLLLQFLLLGNIHKWIFSCLSCINILYVSMCWNVFLAVFWFQESDSEVEDSLDDLEKHLREKALRSMRKAQMSPSQMSWKQGPYSLSKFPLTLDVCHHPGSALECTNC